MKKSIIFTFLFLCFPVFSQTKGIIVGDNVRIRKAPSSNSEIIEKKNLKEIITIYEYSGSGKIINGTWDYWAKIGESKWVNASWIFEEPFYFEYNYDGYVTVEVSKLSNIQENVHIKYPSTYPVIENDIPMDNVLINENELLRGTYLVSKFHVIYLNKESEISKIKNQKNKTNDSSEDKIIYENNGFRITEYQFPVHIGKVEITNPNFILYYGIKIGMSKNELLEILGRPEDSNDKYIKYKTPDQGTIMQLVFYLKNGKIDSIVYTIDI